MQQRQSHARTQCTGDQFVHAEAFLLSLSQQIAMQVIKMKSRLLILTFAIVAIFLSQFEGSTSIHWVGGSSKRACGVSLTTVLFEF